MAGPITCARRIDRSRTEKNPQRLIKDQAEIDKAGINANPKTV
jgi:hypothetical protein